MSGKELERPLFIEMDFGEALARFAQTRPEEVRPPPGQKRKAAKATAEVKRVESTDTEACRPPVRK